jgi:hypothetical protein
MGMKFDHIVFHEGNISRFDQFLVSMFSLTRLRFINVFEDMRVPQTHQFTGSNAPLGYSLMCRFHYYGVWKYLENYKIALRVDEDCLVLKTPNLKEEYGFLTGALSEETHVLTNNTLPEVLREINLEEFYNHKFPYTNVMVTRPSLWLSEEVQKILVFVANQVQSIENRWGDIPVLGVAINANPHLFGLNIQTDDFYYMHISHLTAVKNGLFEAPDFVISVKKPLSSAFQVLKFFSSKK